jgi:mannose-6-phosphate isomerase-like protein (cupin superfamily)
MKDWVLSLAKARSTPLDPGRRSSLLLAHGTMSLRFYAPNTVDPQTPHDQDEIYVVVSGHGTVVSGPSEDTLTSKAFGPGDAIFVPAGNVHRFVEFTDDLQTWVIFWGPVGGEAQA